MKVVKVIDVIEKENKDYPLFMFRLHKKKYKIASAKTPKKGWTNYPYEKHYRAVSTLFLFLFLATTLSAQEITILLLNSDKQPIENAVVNVDGKNNVTDNSGIASFTPISDEREIKINVTHILYIELDTILNMSDQFLTLTLQEKQFSLPIIDIGYRQSLYEKSLNIIASWSKETEIYVIAEHEGKYSLEVYDLEGIFLSKEILDTRYFDFFHIQGSSRVHLLNNHHGLEIDISNPSNILKVSKKTAQEYDKIKKIKVIYDKGLKLIYEEQADFNQSISISRIDTKSYEKEELYVHLDSEGLDNAKYHYRKIISLYKRLIVSDDKTRISYGIPQRDIIAEGEWNGDPFDLIISREMVHPVGYFKNVITKKKDTKYILTIDYLYFIDPFTHKLIIIDLASDKSSIANTITISKDNDIFESEGNIYIVSKDTVYKLIDNNQLTLHAKIDKGEEILLITKGNIIYYDKTGCRCIIKRGIK